MKALEVTKEDRLFAIDWVIEFYESIPDHLFSVRYGNGKRHEFKEKWYEVEGLCDMLLEAICERFGFTYGFLINEFSIHEASQVFFEFKPSDEDSATIHHPWWWDHRDKQSRIDYLHELKKKQ